MDEKSVQDLIAFLFNLSDFKDFSIQVPVNYELFFCSNYLTNWDPFPVLMKVRALYNLDAED